VPACARLCASTAPHSRARRRECGARGGSRYTAPVRTGAGSRRSVRARPHGLAVQGERQGLGVWEQAGVGAGAAATMGCGSSKGGKNDKGDPIRNRDSYSVPPGTDGRCSRRRPSPLWPSPLTHPRACATHVYKRCGRWHGEPAATLCAPWHGHRACDRAHASCTRAVHGTGAAWHLPPPRAPALAHAPCTPPTPTHPTHEQTRRNMLCAAADHEPRHMRTRAPRGACVRAP